MEVFNDHWQYVWGPKSHLVVIDCTGDISCYIVTISNYSRHNPFLMLLMFPSQFMFVIVLNHCLLMADTPLPFLWNLHCYNKMLKWFKLFIVYSCCLNNLQFAWFFLYHCSMVFQSAGNNGKKYTFSMLKIKNNIMKGEVQLLYLKAWYKPVKFHCLCDIDKHDNQNIFISCMHQ